MRWAAVVCGAALGLALGAGCLGNEPGPPDNDAPPVGASEAGGDTGLVGIDSGQPTGEPDGNRSGRGETEPIPTRDSGPPLEVWTERDEATADGHTQVDNDDEPAESLCQRLFNHPHPAEYVGASLSYEGYADEPPAEPDPDPECVDADRDGRGPGCRLGSDCDDRDPFRYRWLHVYRDDDHDFFGVGPAVSLCTGRWPRVGWAIAAGDCDDANSLLHPGAPLILLDEGSACPGLAHVGAETAVFVDLAAPCDGGSRGSPSCPFGTVGEGIAAAEAEQVCGLPKAVIIAEGEYDEDLVTSATLVGGFRNASGRWEHRPNDAEAVIHQTSHIEIPTDSRVALAHLTLVSAPGYRFGIQASSGTGVALTVYDVTFRPEGGLRYEAVHAPWTGTMDSIRVVGNRFEGSAETVLAVSARADRVVVRDNVSTMGAERHCGGYTALGLEITVENNTVHCDTTDDPGAQLIGVMGLPNSFVGGVGRARLADNVIELRGGNGAIVGLRAQSANLDFTPGFAEIDGNRIAIQSPDQRASGILTSAPTLGTKNDVRVNARDDAAAWDIGSASPSVYLFANHLEVDGLGVLANCSGLRSASLSPIVAAHNTIRTGPGCERERQGIGLRTGTPATLVNNLVADVDVMIARRRFELENDGALVVLGNNAWPMPPLGLFRDDDAIVTSLDQLEACQFEGCSEATGNLSVAPALAPDQLHLSADSPLIDAGVDTAQVLGGPLFDRDIDDEPRPDGEGWDIGADEHFAE